MNVILRSMTRGLRGVGEAHLEQHDVAHIHPVQPSARVLRGDHERELSGRELARVLEPGAHLPALPLHVPGHRPALLEEEAEEDHGVAESVAEDLRKHGERVSMIRNP